jgi:hypothetical protein
VRPPRPPLRTETRVEPFFPEPHPTPFAFDGRRERDPEKDTPPSKIVLDGAAAAGPDLELELELKLELELELELKLRSILRNSTGMPVLFYPS